MQQNFKSHPKHLQEAKIGHFVAQHLPFQKQDGACSPQFDTKPGAPKKVGSLLQTKNKCYNDYNVSAAAYLPLLVTLHGVHGNNLNPDQPISQSWPILSDLINPGPRMTKGSPHRS